ncbi:hypothetical protein Hanom_Chr07g00627611 [Helianthus anomalus]
MPVSLYFLLSVKLLLFLLFMLSFRLSISCGNRFLTYSNVDQFLIFCFLPLPACHLYAFHHSYQLVVAEPLFGLLTFHQSTGFDSPQLQVEPLIFHFYGSAASLHLPVRNSYHPVSVS